MGNFKSVKIYLAGHGEEDGMILEADNLDTKKGEVAIYSAKAKVAGEDKGPLVGYFILADVLDALAVIEKSGFHDTVA